MIRLDYRDSRPIYEQVRDGLRRLMVTGVMQPGEQLPSCGAWPWSWRSTPTPSSGPMPSWSRRGTSTPCPAAERSWRRAVSRTGVGAASCASRLRPMLEELRSLGFTLEELAALWKEGEHHA